VGGGRWRGSSGPRIHACLDRRLPANWRRFSRRRLMSWRGCRPGPSRSTIGWRCWYCCCVTSGWVFPPHHDHDVVRQMPHHDHDVVRQVTAHRAPVELQMPGPWPRSTTTVTGQKIVCFPEATGRPQTAEQLQHALMAGSRHPGWSQRPRRGAEGHAPAIGPGRRVAQPTDERYR
jgi:hypothetical protein